MNIRNAIEKMLENCGCAMREEAGIWYITTPYGEVWDMTVPMVNWKLTAMLPVKEKSDGQ